MPPPRKQPAKKPPVKKPPVKKAAPTKAPPGLFSDTLLRNLKTMPPGTSDRAIIVETLRSVPVERWKDALAKATPQERNLLFSVLPADYVRAFLGSIPEATLGPAKPPAPPPSPVGGPPASILQTTYTNVPFPPAATDRHWAEKLTGGKTIQDFGSGVFEWTSVYDPSFEKEGSLNNPAVGLTGWVVPAKNPGGLSGGDIWFVHPWGNDWEYYIVPDPQYESLLGFSNTGTDPVTGKTTEQDYKDATAHARENLHLKAPSGVLGVESDQNLVPPSFRDWVTDGARIATFGRWIVDSGHPDFHTEIHAPLLMAVAKPAPPPAGVQASQMTRVEFMSRPYTVSQRFSEGNFVNHLITEVAKVETTIFGFPLSWRVEAHPTVFTTPYQGRPYIKLLVKPPVPRNPLRAQDLIVNFHFTYRQGVAVRVYNAGNDTVGVIIVLGDLNPAQLPPKHDLTINWDQLGNEYSWIIDGLQIADILLGKELSAIVLNRGILTDSYDPPSASSPGDFQNVAAPVPINQLPPTAGFFEDDDQPFPIYGWMNVYWQTPNIVHQ